VAINALFFSVCAGQREPGEVMVEGFFFEPDNLEIEPVMITVTNNAFLPPDFCGGMVTFADINPGFQFRMAFQAFLVGNFLSQHMAMGTV
jgi:hypothetical protein